MSERLRAPPQSLWLPIAGTGLTSSPQNWLHFLARFKDVPIKCSAPLLAALNQGAGKRIGDAFEVPGVWVQVGVVVGHLVPMPFVHPEIC